MCFRCFWNIPKETTKKKTTTIFVDVTDDQKTDFVDSIENKNTVRKTATVMRHRVHNLVGNGPT